MTKAKDFIKNSKFDEAAKMIGAEINMVDIKGKEL